MVSDRLTLVSVTVTVLVTVTVAAAVVLGFTDDVATLVDVEVDGADAFVDVADLVVDAEIDEQAEPLAWQMRR